MIKQPKKNNQNNKNKKPDNKKNFIIWAALFFAFILFSEFFLTGPNVGASEIKYHEFIQKVNSGSVNEVQIKGKELTFDSDGQKYYVFLPDDPKLIEKLEVKNVAIDAKPTISKAGKVIGGLLGWLPFIIMIGLWLFLFKGAAGGGGKAFGFGKSKAKLLQEHKNKVTFKDVAGIDEAKEELVEIVDFLKNHKKYTELGAKIPKGCLLIGSPGTGKTLLARAVAGEASVPFFSISGSDFVEMFVGVGASRVRDMFEQGKQNAPCLIFIDEIDAVGRHRGSGVGGGNDEREQTLNQLLVEMDGFSANEGIIIIAATNRPDVLDNALLRPGRFDRQVTVPNPDIIGRDEILNVHLKKIKSINIDTKVVARGTPGFSGADLANLVNEAALLAAKNNQKVVTMQNIEDAKDKIMMGAERKKMVMDKDEKSLTAYHEAGHAIVAINCPNSDPIHKATIIPRGRALGLVMRLPEKDRFSLTRAKLIDDLAVAMGGRVAEEMIFGYDKVTTGASSDIEQATKMARSMVTKWGLNDKIGAVDYGNDNSENPYQQSKTFSEETAKHIDQEIKKIIENASKQAKKILTDKKEDFKLLAESLLKYETLTGDEIKALLKDGKINKTEKNKKPKVTKSFIPKAGG
ncbi:ATP-dependent zinc metalloprotease FtsH [Rickettsiales bacterium]|nr:ATP-dependent zinc metalloprotease FtsH [Rickettsiales bacterium]